MWRKIAKQQSHVPSATNPSHSAKASAQAAEPSSTTPDWPPVWDRPGSHSPYDQLEEITDHLKACIAEITKLREERDYSNTRGDMTGK